VAGPYWPAGEPVAGYLRHKSRHSYRSMAFVRDREKYGSDAGLNVAKAMYETEPTG